VTGNTVTLSWTAPAGPVTGYVVEAGTAAGLANLGTLQIGATPSLVVPGVPAGTYVLRVRAITSAGSGAPSADVVVVVP
jgi:predicted phage tail protein